MKRHNQILGSLLVAIAAPMGGVASAQTQVTVTHTSPLDGLYGAAASAFEKVVEDKLGDSYDVVIQRLDNEREAIEATQLGTQECAFASAGPLGNFVPETRVLDIPYLFDDREQARATLDGEIGQEMLALFEKRGLMGVAWLENGFRHLTTGAKTVSSPADLKGLKIRTMENPVHMEAWSEAGVLPTPMAFSEVPSALQQGTVDGQENPIPIILANNLDQLQSHLYLTRHVYSAGILTCNLGFWRGLSDEDRAVFEEAAAAAVTANRDRVQSDEETGVETLRERGMEVTEIEDITPYREAMSGANAEFEKEFGAETIRRIREAAE